MSRDEDEDLTEEETEEEGRGEVGRSNPVLERSKTMKIKEGNQPVNRTLYHMDNLLVLRSIDSNTIDIIATDPPFKKIKIFMRLLIHWRAVQASRTDGNGVK